MFLTWRAWRPVLGELQKHHDIFAPTLMGHSGGPPYPSGGMGIRPLADAVERQLDALGWDRVHLCGNSLGGWLALELAQRGRAQTVVALSPAGTWTGRASYHLLLGKLRLVAAVSRFPMTELMLRSRAVRALAFRPAVVSGSRISGTLAAALLKDARSCTVLRPLAAWMGQNGPLPQFEVPVEVPVRIAWPVRDRTISWRHHGVVFRDLVPRAEFVQMRGVGHVPMGDDPAQTARVILGATRR